MQAVPNYFKYLQTQFDPGSESSLATQDNIMRSSWGICLQRVKHQPWLTLQSRQLWRSLCCVNQYASWDTYCRMIKRKSLLSVSYTDDVHWAYLLCFSCNLPTSLCCPLVRRHTYSGDYTHTNQCNLWLQLAQRTTLGKDLLQTLRREGVETIVHIYKTATNESGKESQYTQSPQQNYRENEAEQSSIYNEHQPLRSQNEDSEKPHFIKVIFIDSKITYIHC